MADERAGPSLQNQYFYSDSEGECNDIWDSDDSIKDKDYCDSDSDSCSSTSEEEQVRI